MKLVALLLCNINDSVAPFTGAWIEILFLVKDMSDGADVAPFTGAWIEISPPCTTRKTSIVAPFTGAWIEIAKAT